ncbi:MAG: hypothetical protein ISS71_00480 [Phycisphaerae bacterium]|nr:hypothetical protein [Phycisphaerae bacterium]
MTMNHSNSQTLDLLSIFHYVLAALMYLKGAIAFIFMGIGSIAVTGVLADQPDDMAPALIALGLIFFLAPMAFLAVSWIAGTLVLFAGRRIAKRTHLIYCQIIAGLECICFPFGTILGIITLMNLTKPEAKESFQA